MTKSLVSILIASAISSVVIFLFGFVAFTVVAPPDWFQQPLPDGSQVPENLKGLASGMYVYPYPDSGSDEAMESLMQTMKSGPIFTLYLNSGYEFNLAISMVQELARGFLASTAVCILLSIAHTNLCCFAHRVFFVALCGLFAAISCETTYSIWYWRPVGATAWMFGATLVGWILAAPVMAAIVKPWRGTASHPAVEKVN